VIVPDCDHERTTKTAHSCGRRRRLERAGQTTAIEPSAHGTAAASAARRADGLRTAAGAPANQQASKRRLIDLLGTVDIAP
jgi:hypothetical protein